MRCDVVVLADTHLRSDRPRWLPDRVLTEIRRAGAVLHAGDVLDAGVLDRLRVEAGGPVHAVLGNNDTTMAGALPRTLVLELAGTRIGMVHDSGRAAGRAARLHRLFPDCRVVVFGHSHVPLAETGVDGQLLFNPGSATQRRRQPAATFGLLHLREGEVAAHEIIEL